MTRWLTLAAFIMLLTGTAFAAEKRVALVVGNSTYQFAPRLLNTENDAQDITTALQKVDFDVEILLNADRLQLEAAVRRLGQRSRDAAASVFYYAGHAVEIAGRNW